MSTVCDIENGPVEIVDFPMNSMVIFHSYVSLPEGKSIIHPIINHFEWLPTIVSH